MTVKFQSMKLRPELVAACLKQGFREATPIQALVIPVVLKGRDVVVEAKTGSGKTLAYGLPMLHAEPLQTEFPESLVVTPTRELADQIVAELERSKGGLDRKIVALTGGGGMDKQKAKLDEGATIVVGTMGRIEEMLARDLLRLTHVRRFVLDEVDELLRGGFSANLAALFGRVPAERQTMLFSATVPTEVEQVARQFTRQAERLRMTVSRELPSELSHRVLFTTVDGRIADLVAFLKAEKAYQALIFCGTKHETEEVHEAMAELGLEAEFLHGDLSPTRRRKLIEHFRGGDLPVLVASDLAARGLDLPGVDLVVNYSLPQGVPAYLHRAGRTGRAGRPGSVVSLVIGQQHEKFEKLKATFQFQSLDVQGGRVVRHTMKSREARDLEFRQLPRVKPVYEKRPPPEARPESDKRKPSRDGKRDAAEKSERPAKSGGARRDGTGRDERPSRGGKGRPDAARPPRDHRPKKGGPRPSTPRAPAPRGGKTDGPRRDEGRPDRDERDQKAAGPHRVTADAPHRDERGVHRTEPRREHGKPKVTGPRREERSFGRDGGKPKAGAPRREERSFGRDGGKPKAGAPRRDARTPGRDGGKPKAGGPRRDGGKPPRDDRRR